jgi:hypothetical protein
MRITYPPQPAARVRLTDPDIEHEQFGLDPAPIVRRLIGTIDD